MNSVVIRRNGGFYYVFDDDAIIVSYLMNYKVSNGRCGFPLNSLNKVTNVLEDNKVNYAIRENMKDINGKNYKKGNKYNYILDKGKKNLDINYRINGIMDRLNDLSYDELSTLLSKFEEYMNEQ